MDDYKKKYEKAVEWLRDGLYAASRGTMKEEMEKYFPELAESDEASIRKALISLINEGRNGEAFIEIHGVPVADILAWLESKDIKNKVWIYRDVYVREKEHARKDGIDEVLANPQKYGLEKQGEQKPAEWSENDKHMAHHIGNAITTHEAGCYLEAKNIEVIDAHVWLYSLKDRVQPKQEWSEEDEKMFNEIILDLKVLKYRDTGEAGKAAYQREIDWLKSLRPQPQWKPSEKQINALAKNVEYVKVGCTQHILKELLEDLKKLKS